MGNICGKQSFEQKVSEKLHRPTPEEELDKIDGARTLNRHIALQRDEYDKTRTKSEDSHYSSTGGSQHDKSFQEAWQEMQKKE